MFAPESGAHRSEVECRLEAASLHSLPLEPAELWEGVSVRQDQASGALMLRIGEGEVAFLTSSGDAAGQPLACSIAVTPAGLTSPQADTVLMTAEDTRAAAMLAAQGAAVYMASQDGALCIASRGGSSMTIRRG